VVGAAAQVAEQQIDAGQAEQLDPHLEAAPELDDVAVREAAVQLDLSDQLGLVQLAELDGGCEGE
jgi:hypothetical protein